MTLQRSLWAACLVLALVSLVAAFALYGVSLGPTRWFGAVVVLALILGLARSWQSSAVALPLACLAGLVVMGAVSLLLGAPLYLVAPGIVVALGATDLANLPLALSTTSSSAAARRYHRMHLLSLVLVLSLGLLLVAFGSAISLSIPFLPLLLLVIVALFCFDRAVRRANEGWSN